MIVTVEGETTVGALRARIRRTYGDRGRLDARARRDRNDFAAWAALRSLDHHEDADPAEVVHQTRSFVLPDRHLDDLTVRRLQVLVTVGSRDGGFESVRALAATLDRDVKNVSTDVRALERLGLLAVHRRGRGKPSTVRLPGKTIRLEISEPARATPRTRATG
ncbi:MAG TPA: hypothetical protein VI997_12585 [Candidatus Thermoplasmatota archaeon]|nr:hypothetical protein [Candidatus Thermoplasmatota archaeon]